MQHGWPHMITCTLDKPDEPVVFLSSIFEELPTLQPSSSVSPPALLAVACSAGGETEGEGWRTLVFLFALSTCSGQVSPSNS